MKIGQLFMCGVAGTTLSEDEKDFIQNMQIGGVILFSNNFEDPAQLAELVNEIQVLRDEYPLFISVDHEGGRVLRFRQHFTQFPAMGELAKQQSPKLVYEVHQVMGKELSACGINLSLSPVCDILFNKSNKVIGDRSFGSSASEVEKYVSAAIRGLHAEGVLACPKHFPGHGRTKEDSHDELPESDLSIEELKNHEFSVFRKASRSRSEFMMVSHLLFKSVDPDWPTSLSPKWYQILRDEIKFQKIAISDDMQMNAITEKYGVEEAAVRCLYAGTDVLEYRDMDVCAKALKGVEKAVEDGGLEKESIQVKLKRIEDCKKEHLKNYRPIYIPEITSHFNSDLASEVLAKIQNKA